MIVLHNAKKGNNWIVAKTLAERFKCKTFSVKDDGDIDLSKQETVLFVLSNTGDEELPQPMEDFLFKLDVRGKNYLACELGNYFGLESYCGCKKVLFKLLDKLEWKRISDVSLDSMPELDHIGLEKWMQSIEITYLP